LGLVEEMQMAYTLSLTEEDITTIDFVGGRYGWSRALRRMEVGENRIAEHEAWEICEAFEADTEGGHSPFPMLDPRSELAEKLNRFWVGVV